MNVGTQERFKEPDKLTNVPDLRSSDIDGLGDETVMPSLKGRPARPLTTQLALGDLDEPNQTQTVPWHLIALAVAYVAWAVLTRGRHDKT